jgi:hypothetical protein
MIITDRISRALGDAVVRMWAGLPHDLQSRLFNEVVAENEDMKPNLGFAVALEAPTHEREANSHALLSSPIHWEVKRFAPRMA